MFDTTDLQTGQQMVLKILHRCKTYSQRLHRHICTYIIPATYKLMSSIPAKP